MFVHAWTTNESGETTPAGILMHLNDTLKVKASSINITLYDGTVGKVQVILGCGTVESSISN